MKKEDILKQINKDIEINTPDILSKIDLTSIEIEDTVTELSPSKSKFFNFKILIPVTSFLIILIFTFAFIYKGNSEGIVNDNIRVTNKDQIVANYAVSALELIDVNANTLISLSSNNNSDDYIKTFNSYSNIFLEYLGLTDTKVKIFETNDKIHPYTMEIISTDFFGVKHEYVLNYFETREDDDDEVQKEMKGIITYNDLVYTFQVDQELESDEEEIEIVIKRDNLKIEIEKEVEVDEYKMEYILYINDKEVSKVVFESDEKELVLKVETKDKDYEYEITKIDLNLYLIEIEDYRFELKIDRDNKKIIFSK